MPPAANSSVAVQFGAGNIGRGFMGELFAASGYRVLFIDVDRAVVDAAVERRAYEVHHVSTDRDEVVAVRGVSALEARQAGRVAEAVAGAALVCTAVGVRALKAVAPALAAGLALRLARPDAPPLNVITCENLVGAGTFLGELVWSELQRLPSPPPCSHAAFHERVGFVEAVVSRMVPIVPDDVRRRDPLWIACEPYARLPVDRDAFRGPVPRIVGLEPVAPILAYQRRKLASHNMSHALCAYLGYRAGHTFIWEAVEDPSILDTVRRAMSETGRALCARFGFDPAVQRTYEDDLLERYRNRALGDQVCRVAADPLRKLGPEDRLIGSARLCLEEDVDPVGVIAGIRAALAYDAPNDLAAARLQAMCRADGLAHVLRDVCGLTPGEPLFARLLAEG